MVINIRDQHRRQKSIRALQKAKKLLEKETLRLSQHECMPYEELYRADDAHMHVCQALERLGVQVDED